MSVTCRRSASVSRRRSSVFLAFKSTIGVTEGSSDVVSDFRVKSSVGLLIMEATLCTWAQIFWEIKYSAQVQEY